MAVTSAGCAGSGSDVTTDPTAMVDAGGTAGASDASVAPIDIPDRVYDYNAALRIASLRLRGTLPTLAEIKQLANAPEEQKRETYEAMITEYMDTDSVEFRRQIFDFWRNTFKMGGDDLDTAPALAAQLTIESRNFTELFTATTGTCPTFNRDTGAFTAQNCNNNVPTHAGVLTNPGVMKHFQSPMAFRRVRWVQETFDCTAFPAEASANPEDVGGAQVYTGLLPFTQLAAPGNGGTLDFQDASSTVCGNCHSTINIMAPLFGNFDDDGRWQNNIVVELPIEGTPAAKRSDYITDAASTGWRQGMPANSLPELGAVMASDPGVAECMVARAWNFAMGRGDVVDALAVVPSSVIAEHVTAFQESGYDLKQVFYKVFTDPNFVQF